VPTVPQLVRERHRPRSRDRASHCDRRQRLHSGVVDRWQRNHGARETADGLGRTRGAGDISGDGRWRRHRMSVPTTHHPKATAPESDAPSTAAVKVRILVVDDEPSMREMLRIVLRRDGYEVLIAENGRDAIEQLRRTTVDLLLSDIKMPDVTGVEVLRAAKEINRDIVAFMMTAYA